MLSLPPAFALSQDQTLTLKDDPISKVTYAELTEPHLMRTAFPPLPVSSSKRSDRRSLVKAAKPQAQGSKPAARKDPAAYVSLSRLHLSKSTAAKAAKIPAKTNRPQIPRLTPGIQSQPVSKKTKDAKHASAAASR